MLYPSPIPRPTSLEQLAPAGLLRRLDRLDILSRKILAGKLPGERRSKRRGQSVEFDDYRDYVSGDDLRHIDWNVLARLDRLFIKLFREDEDLSVHLVVDASPSMDAGGDPASPARQPSKLVFALRLAMALGYVGLVNQNRVQATLLGAPGRPMVQTLAPIRGRRTLQKLAAFVLEQAGPPPGWFAGSGPAQESEPTSGRGALGRALRLLASRRHGRGVIVLISDLLVSEDLGWALSAIAGGVGFDATIIQILSPGELDPAQEPGGVLIGDLRLSDAETGRPADVTISAALLQRYKARLAEHIEMVRVTAGARQIGHMLVRSDADAAELVLSTLRRRGLVG